MARRPRRRARGPRASTRRVLVIDDASPDGTGELADRLAAELGFLTSSTASARRGSGPPTSPGSDCALEPGAELVATIDCDFSHDPADLPRLVAATVAGRHRPRLALRPGGGTRELGRSCAASSAAAARCTRARSSGSPCTTRPRGSRSTGGRCSRPIDPSRIESRGYAFQIETVFRAIRAGFTVEEVPIRFADRTEGGSKMGPEIVLEAVVRVPALRLAAARGRL